jgi:hypothetical protein
MIAKEWVANTGDSPRGALLPHLPLHLQQLSHKVDPLTPSEFHEVFRACCQRHSLPYDETVGEHLIELLRSEFQQPLRPCYPGDLINRVVSAARHERTAPKLDRTTVTQACRNYFLRV